MKKYSPEWKKTQPGINALIKEMHKNSSLWPEIAKELNKKGYTTSTGKPWSSAGVSGYGLKEQLVPRRASTSNGEAGSTGQPNYSPLNGRTTVRRHKKSRKTGNVSYQDLEDIMTSSLNTGLKMKVIKLFSVSGI
jgi:hypothetical protein